MLDRPCPCPYPERQKLRASMDEIFGLVADNATAKQWEDWLRPPIEHAAAKGDLNLVTKLLKAGATGTPGPRGCRGRTLLDAAAEGGSDKVVSALLRAGARPDVSVRSSSKRRSALHRAAIHGHESVARVLMMAGADVGSLDSDKRAPLHLAVRAGHEQLVCSLLLGGANPSSKDKKGNAPLHLAAWHGHAGIACALLLKGADKNVLDFQGRSPLHLTAEQGHRGAADALLAAGADATLRYGENELSVLDSAASYGHVKVLKALIQHGVDLNDTDSTGYTALHMAADNNQARAVGVLIDAGADVESQDLHHWTPLHCVARYSGCCEAMLALLSRGAQVGARESAGEGPLHVAALYLAERAADVLLRWGADETAANGDGFTPAEIIGAYASDQETPEITTPEELEEAEDRLRKLLVDAPADRAWRRRGWVLLCRTRIVDSRLADDDETRSDAERCDTERSDAERKRLFPPCRQAEKPLKLLKIGDASPAGDELRGSEDEEEEEEEEGAVEQGRSEEEESGTEQGGVGEEEEEEEGGGGSVGACSIAWGGKRDAARYIARKAGADAERDGRRGDTESGDDDLDDEEPRCDFKGVFSRLMGLVEEDVFRQVVGFM